MNFVDSKNERLWVIFTFILIFAIVAFMIYSVISAEHYDSRFRCVHSDAWGTIIEDTQTGVQYLTTSHGGTCMLVDADGNYITGGN